MHSTEADLGLAYVLSWSTNILTPRTLYLT